ncbi:uncharacterized protein DUF4129 [Mucilaginibacter yixingensis]|uniref:Uncharacterized protein DUF4129 n=1 Tax=Mucilaginibacter yixingensis TaxID=1295612 RepID=A0A2T5JCL3_9SPHI|nr:DUF4129 domain-containing protein [Mucilaginibacter yixingensis]PTQ99507.1 uncharacterized protein DUF4129 [Mucilaginibacter yixingensis]
MAKNQKVKVARILSNIDSSLTMKKGFILILLLIGLVFAGMAAPLPVKQVKPKHSIVIDSSKVNVRGFNQAALNKYKASGDFNYEDKPESRGSSWWHRFWHWVWFQWNRFWDWVGHVLARLFGKVHGGVHSLSYLRYLLIFVLAVLIAFIVAKLFDIDLRRLFSRKSKQVGGVPYTEEIENIHEIEFDGAIADAVDAKNYRLAVRLLFLRSLKQLADAGLIDWKADKTNSDYARELQNAEHKHGFLSVARQFEYVWYGDFAVAEPLYGQINNSFTDFKHLIVKP